MSNESLSRAGNFAHLCLRGRERAHRFMPVSRRGMHEPSIRVV
jgi:hypothetical protein